MRDIFMFLVVMALVFASFARPWLMTLTYLYIDLIQPQRLSYYLFRGVPISLVVAIAAVALFITDKKKNLRVNVVQVLMALFVIWFTITSERALIQDNLVWFKWDAAWKSVLFGGVFLPLVLATRRRIEAAMAITVLCVGLVTVDGALKTLAGGGGYEQLKMIVVSNNGLYESSTISAVGVAIIPLILYLFDHSPLVGKTVWTRIAALGLCASSVLIVIGTEARTGLVCFAALAGMMLLRSKRKPLFALALVIAAAVTIPVLPDSFKTRMLTIVAPNEEGSAATRTSIWGWTLKFAKQYPLGGGFRVNRLNKIAFDTPVRDGTGAIVRYQHHVDKARAFHSAYFEVLAEQGWPGLILYLSILIGTLIQLGAMMRKYRKADPEERWKHDLAQAIYRAIMIFMVGGAFTGIAYQTMLYMLVAIGIAHLQVNASRGEIARRTTRVPFVRASTPALANA